ncbi:MAG TPA: HNH endonuclease [Pyrinomonadaceae bacterium]|nr:HNH endonuclease [Pyrinomonadaceae bacterium]
MASLNGRVLLLNFSYEPLGTVGVARAVCLVVRGTVYVEEYEGERVLRSPSAEFRVPSVVRLRAYVNVRRRRQPSGWKRLRIFVRDGFRCQYCGGRFAARDLTLDHVTPRSRAGRSTPENLVAACARCNARKADRTPEEARMPLLTTQRALRVGLDTVMLCHYAESRPEWRKYLFPGAPVEEEQLLTA